jgi:SAM-dependent methyltransferase
VTIAANENRAEAFAERLVGALNESALILMASLGHRLALFDRLATLPPATSGRIAEAAGLQERYVREWLGAMVVSGVVEYDPAEATYSLPAEHAAALTRAAGPNNLAGVAAYVPVLAAVEDEIAECFRTGGGVTYSSYPRLQEVMAEDSGAVFDATLIGATLPLVPGLVGRLREGIAVADLGCGSGHAVNLMAKAFPASRFVGYDLSEDAIERASEEAAELGLGNARFAVKDLATLDEPDTYDLIAAFDVIHDQARPAQVLERIARALAPEGAFLMVDFAASSSLEENVDHALAPTLYMFSVLHCMTVSLAQNGAGLGTLWGEQTALQMLREAGFADVDVERVEADPFNNYYICRLRL